MIRISLCMGGIDEHLGGAWENFLLCNLVWLLLLFFLFSYGGNQWPNMNVERRGVLAGSYDFSRGGNVS